MKTRFITALLAAAALLAGCSKETPEGGAPGNGNRVVFTLAGITPQQQNDTTRAAGDNGAAKPETSAATEGEKKVTTLLAAAYEKQPSGKMGFYRTFDVTVTDGGCSFDIAKDGRFDLYLVANADATLAGAVKALGAGSEVSALEQLLVAQAPDTENAFVMTTPEVLKIISYSGEVADCGEVSLRRLSMRIDLLNKAEGLTITKVTFRNRAVKSRLFTPNAMLAEAGAVEDKEYTGLNLVGNFDVPAEYKSKIYGYENLSRRGEATVPTLDIEYTYNNQTYTHTVEFLDRNDQSGQTPLALKRNYLYRITVGRKVEPEFSIQVLDWTNEQSFNVEDITFQAEMNAKLAINHFAGANVKTIDEAKGKVTFTTDDPHNTSAYVAWNAEWATSVYHNDADNSYYRLPTKEEMYLLFPDDQHMIRFDTEMDGTSEITETLPETLFGSKAKNGGAGKSWFKNAAATVRAQPAFPIVYAIRFKGTAQCAAYRYENKNSGDATKGELEIRIKALQANSLLTIGEVANEAYWGNPATDNSDAENQLVYHIAAAGYKEQASGEEIKNKGVNSFLWTSTQTDGANACDAGHNAERLRVISDCPKTKSGSLRLVKVTEEDMQKEDQKRRNAALKVNMFTPFNVKSVDLRTKTITAFYDKLTVSKAECPTESYISYKELQEAGMTTADATFTGPDGKKYRLPTAGECTLLLPMYMEEDVRPDGTGKKVRYSLWWNDNASTNKTAVMVKDAFNETIYLKNGSDNYPDKTHSSDTDSEYTLKGQSQLKLGTMSETVHYYTKLPDVSEKGNYNVYPVYGLRFKGTSQYAAYRWETCKFASNPLERYLSIKIKALKKDDIHTTIDMIAQEEFWKEGFIEFKIPASGHYTSENIGNPTPDNISYHGVGGSNCTSTLYNGGTEVRSLNYGLNSAHVSFGGVDYKYPLRMVRVE